MKPELRRVGNSQSPVVVIDDFSGESDRAATMADALAPFPDVDPASYYPGVRRLIEPADESANAYVDRVCERRRL